MTPTRSILSVVTSWIAWGAAAGFLCAVAIKADRLVIGWALIGVLAAITTWWLRTTGDQRRKS